MEHKCEQLLMKQNGACLVLNSESCHRNSPVATRGDMNIKKTSFHKLGMRRRGVRGLLARFAGSCLTRRGAEREGFVL